MTYPSKGQRKLNGLRGEYENGNFISGDGVVWPHDLVKHILEPLNRFMAHYKFTNRLRLDGEFYRHGWSLQKINKFIGVGNKSARPETAEVGFRVFDVNMTRPFEPDRIYQAKAFMRLLKKWPEKINVKMVKTVDITSQSEADAWYEDCIRKGYEGAIYRLARTPKGAKIAPDGKLYSDDKGQLYRDPLRSFKLTDKEKLNFDLGYLEGKRPYWILKRKEKHDSEYEIIAMHEGKVTDKGGKHVGRMGSVTCITKIGDAFNVGGGFSDQQRQKYWDERKIKSKTIIGKKLRVKYGRLSDLGIPCEPRAWDGNIRDYA